MKEIHMRHFILFSFLLFFISGCGGSSSGSSLSSGTIFAITNATSWFITSPDTDLSQYSSVNIKVTFTNNDSTNDMTFNTSPQFQLWSVPDSYDFIGAGDVTINSEPSGTVPPGGNYSYDLTVDLTNIPAGQVHLALRPVDNLSFGSIGPTYTSVVSSTVTFTP